MKNVSLLFSVQYIMGELDHSDASSEESGWDSETDWSIDITESDATQHFVEDK